MTTERIAELRALAEKATPGPWVSVIDAPHYGVGSSNSDLFETVGDQTDEDLSNCDFIAAARTALPDALNSIEWVRTQCELWLHYPEDSVPLNKVAAIILAALEGKPA